MADGSIKINVELDNAKAQAQLDKLDQKIEKIQEKINNGNSRKSAIATQLDEARQAAERASEAIKDIKAEMARFAELNSNNGKIGAKDYQEYVDLYSRSGEWDSEIARQQKIYDASIKKIAGLEEEEAKVDQQIKQQTAELERQNRVRQEAIGASEKMAEMGRDTSALSMASQNAKNGIKSFIKYGLGITSLIVLFNKLRQAVKTCVLEFAAQDKETRDNINGLKQALATLRVSWGAAFAPIVNAIIPLLQKLVEWLTAAANAVARFFAILGGRATYKRAVANNNALAGSIGGVGAAAEEAKKQLAGFDELNILTADHGGGGGGGGYNLVEEPVGEMPLATTLRYIIDGLKGDWSEWNEEAIAAAINVGLWGITGLIVGGTLGHPIIGLVAGIVYGLYRSGKLFNFDGVLSTDEVVGMILDAMPAIAGLIIGGAVGHPIIGLALGIAFQLGLDAFKAQEDPNIKRGLRDALIILTGLALGALVGGPLGAVVGTTIALMVTLALHCEDAKTREDLHNEGKDLGEETIAGYEEGVEGKKQTVWAKIAKWFDDLVTKDVSEALGIASPSTVFRQLGEYTIEGFREGIDSRFPGLSTGLIEKFSSLKDDLGGIVDKIKGLFNFSFQIPHISLPHLQVNWEPAGSLLARFLGISAIPHLSVSWYARGGIVDGATLIGAGEAGKEAIVPLERNTEWINTVADGLMERLASRSFTDKLAAAFANTPLPAMASGNVLPPKIAVDGMSGEWSASMLDRVNELLEAVGRLASQPVQVDSRMYIDKRQIGQAVSEYQRSAARAGGK